MPTFDIKATNDKILNDLKEVISIECNITDKRLKATNLRIPRVAFHIDETEFVEGFKSVTAESNFSVIIAIATRDYEAGSTLLSDIAKQVQQLWERKEYTILSMDYDQYLEDYNVYATLIRFSITEECLENIIKEN